MNTSSRRIPKRHDLEITAGDGFPFVIRTKTDLTGYAIQITARRDPDLNSPKIWDFNLDNTRVIVTPLGGTPAKWSIRFVATPAETRAVGGGAVWDLQITPPAPNNIPRTWVTGEVRKIAEVSA
jgi:hypothetical protein